MRTARAAKVLAATTFLAAVQSGTAALSQTSPAQAQPIRLAPHRAIYEMELVRADPSSGISGVDGRLVFEMLGSACAGYTVNMRFVSSIQSQDDSTTSDLRSTSHEEGDGSAYRFVSRSFFNDTLNETTDGVARRSEDEVRVDLDMPEDVRFSIGEGVLFPTQHVRLILEAAQAGRTIVEARVYDGSDGGRTAYDATAVIGEPRRPGAVAERAEWEDLSEFESWPITIAYFEDEPAPAVTPSYEFSYDIFANGVSSRIELDYGEFAIGGSLQSLDLVEPTPC